MVKKQSTERSEQLAGAIAAALAKFAKMIKADDILFQKYEERYFTKDVDQIIEDLLIISDNDPAKLLRRINVLEEQFNAYKTNVEKQKGDGYERIVTKTPGSQGRGQRSHKQGANRG